jgi:hypothetical protein
VVGLRFEGDEGMPVALSTQLPSSEEVGPTLIPVSRRT